MDNTLISVIVPVYNVAEYLEECLSSLANQTFSDFEVIMVNDGSEDDSGEIAGRFEERNSHFILINRENGGLSAARNTGLAAARGRYVYFLDSDDYLAPDALEKLYSNVNRNALDVLKFSAYTFHDHEKDYSWSRENGYKYMGDYPGVYKGIDILHKFVGNNDIFPSCCLLISRRELIVNNGLRFQEGIINEDNLFHFELLALSERVGVLNEPLYYRRFRKGSITQAPDYCNRIRSMCISSEKTDEFMESHALFQYPAGKWQILFFIHEMIDNWEKLTADAQRSDEVQGYFKRVEPIAEKYGYGGNRAVRLFFLHKRFYKLYRNTAMTAKKALGRL